MEFEINKKVYTHDVINPPTETNSCDITLMTDSPSCLFELAKGSISAYTEHELTVKKPTELGFTSSEQSIFITEFRNLILALNLTLRRVCITGENPLIAQGGINLKPPSSRVNTHKNGNHTTVTVEETVGVRDEVHITVGLSEKIACLEATPIFQKVQSLDRFNHSKAKSLGISNFFKALKEYEDGMLARDRPSKFKHIFIKC